MEDKLEMEANQIGGIAAEQLRQYIERIERLETEKKGLMDDIRDIFAEAKSSGFDPKVMRQVLKERKLDQDERDEQETLLAVYKRALNME